MLSDDPSTTESASSKQHPLPWATQVECRLSGLERGQELLERRQAQLERRQEQEDRVREKEDQVRRPKARKNAEGISKCLKRGIKKEINRINEEILLLRRSQQEGQQQEGQPQGDQDVIESEVDSDDATTARQTSLLSRAVHLFRRQGHSSQ